MERYQVETPHWDCVRVRVWVSLCSCLAVCVSRGFRAWLPMFKPSFDGSSLSLATSWFAEPTAEHSVPLCAPCQCHAPYSRNGSNQLMAGTQSFARFKETSD